MTRFLLIVLLVLGGCADHKITLRLGVSPEEPGPTVAEALAESIRDADIEVSITVLDKPDDLLAALASETLELALVEEPSSAYPDVATVLPLYPSVLHVIAREATANATLPDALGGRVYAGLPGSNGRRLVEELANDFAIADFRLLDDPWTETPDVYFVFGGLLSNDAVNQLAGFSLVDPSARNHQAGESIIDAIALKHPNLRPFTLPANVYPALGDESIRTLAITTLLAAGKLVEEDIVYRITQRLIENPRPILSVYPLASAISMKDLDLDSFALPLHDGARRYMNRDRPGFLERHIDLIALITTLVLAAASASIGWTHRRRRARKERIDRYLTALLDVRAKIVAGGAGAGIDRLDRIEKEVLELVVSEKIEIDSGLVAFLQLSASVRAQQTYALDTRRAAADAASRPFRGAPRSDFFVPSDASMGLE
jgi:hypothetical protein